MDRWLIAVITFATAFGLSYVSVRQTIPFAKARGLLDTTGPRKVNPNRLPRLAGPAILIAFLAGLGMTWILGVDRFPEERNRILLLVPAAVLLVGVMIVDDIRGIRASIKLGIQIVVALILVGPYA